MSPTGRFIWYELMTGDVTAAANFYGAVVGWTIEDRSDPASGGLDYRMIRRSDGGRLLMPPAGKADAKSDVFDVTTAQHVRWNEIASPDQKRAKQFYAKQFGFVFKDSMPMGAMGNYDFIDHAGLRLGAIMQKSPHGPNAAWLFYSGVQSVNAAKAAIEKGGSGVMNGPHPVPGGDWVVTAVDQEGAAFGVVGPQGA